MHVLDFSGGAVNVVRAAKHLQKVDFMFMQTKRCNAESTNFVKRHTAGGYVLFMAGAVWSARMPACGIESISGDLKEDWYYRSA